MLDGWLTGEPVGDSAGAKSLRRRLVRAGMLHPVPEASSARGHSSVVFVVPVYDDADGLDGLLGALRREFPSAPVVVVDDASAPDAARAIIEVAARHGAELVRHDTNRGPAAARNLGWSSYVVASPGGATIRPDAVVFLDADVVPAPGALGTMSAHFADEDVAAVAPRVRACAGSGVIAAYEADNSPLDMGTSPAIVHPGSRISYVPSAALAVRTTALQDAGGFDESLRFGEDVDLVWKLVDAGSLVRFDPAAVVEHRNRSSLGAFARQRFSYGSSAAELAARHGDKVSPLQLPMPVVGAVLAALFGRRPVRLAAGAVAFNGAAVLAEQLEGKVDEPAVEAARLAAMTHGYAVQGLAAAATRTWAPLLLPFRRSRRALGLALVVPALVDWMRTRPAVDPVRHLAMRALDHGAYCAGVWAGALRRRSIAALLPSVRFRFDEPDR